MWNAKVHQMSQYVRTNVVKEFPELKMKPKTGVQAWALLNDKSLKRLVVVCSFLARIRSTAVLLLNISMVLCSLCQPSSAHDWGAWGKSHAKDLQHSGGQLRRCDEPHS
jgi:hypothetical protein